MTETLPSTGVAGEKAWSTIGDLYHAYATGLMLMLVSRKGPAAAGEWTRMLFRHQHHEKFLSSYQKLGLDDMPDAVSAAAYHYLSNGVGGVGVQFMRESDKKAWVRFVPPRWMYEGPALCGIPDDVVLGMLRGWYAENGRSLKNPRLGFVCTSLDSWGEYGLAGYFWERDHDIGEDERLILRPAEEPPPFDAAAAPKLPETEWNPVRVAKVARSYSMEYVRSGLPRLVELFGPEETRWLGGLAGRIIGAQYYRKTADNLGVSADGPEGFAGFLVAMAEAEGDTAEWMAEGDIIRVRRTGWRLGRGIEDVHAAVFDAWTGLLDGALQVHDRFLKLDPVPQVSANVREWTIRKR